MKSFFVFLFREIIVDAYPLYEILHMYVVGGRSLCSCFGGEHDGISSI